MTDKEKLLFLKDKAGLDTDFALGLSEDESSYLSIVEDYYITIENRYKMIEDYYNNGDLDNYRIQVHGLKSTSRVIGAISLSEMAKSIEEACINGSMDVINENAFVLLKKYMELKSVLDELYGSYDDSDLPEISEEHLNKLIEAMVEGADSFDLTLIEDSFEELSAFKLPSDFKDKYNKLKLALAEVDYDAVIDILS